MGLPTSIYEAQIRQFAPATPFASGHAEDLPLFSPRDPNFPEFQLPKVTEYMAQVCNDIPQLNRKSSRIPLN